MVKGLFGYALAGWTLALGAGVDPDRAVARLPDAGVVSAPMAFGGELRKQGPGTTAVARDDLCAVGVARLAVADGTLAVSTAEGTVSYPPPPDSRWRGHLARRRPPRENPPRRGRGGVRGDMARRA